MKKGISAVEALIESTRRQDQRVGYSRKRRRHSSNGAKLVSVVAGEILAEAGGTIAFDKNTAESKQIGCKTLWQHIAWHFAVEQLGTGLRRIAEPDLVQRGQSVQFHASRLCSGFYAFRDFHERGWGDKYPVFFVPASATSKIIVAMTCDPDYELLDGKGAMEVAITRNVHQGSNRILSHAQRAARLGQSVPEFVRAVRRTVSDIQHTVDLTPRFDFRDKLEDPELQEEFSFA